MNSVFLTVLNMSITASWIAIAVMLLRLVLKKAPKAVMCVLWAFVAIRLIIPFSFESALSLVPSTDTIPSDIIYSESPSVNTGIPAVDNVINPVLSDRFTPENGEGSVAPPSSVIPEEPSAPDLPEDPTPIFNITAVLSLVWIAGVLAMLVYTLVSYLIIRRRVRESVECGEGIMICDRIASPFILGVLRPRIYLPSSMNEGDMEYVIAHERAHLSRRDHLWKPIGFLLLSVYWFNPILWFAYVLLCKDIELACDERVIGRLGVDFKKPYSEALINCSVPRRMVSACPVAFGEVGVKERIRNIMKFKKPTIIICAVAVLVCAAVAVFFLTDPAEEPENEVTGPNILSPEEYPEDIDEFMQIISSSNYYRLLRGPTVPATVYDILLIEKVENGVEENEMKMYAVVSLRFFDENDWVDKGSLYKVDDDVLEFDSNGMINDEKLYDYEKCGKIVDEYNMITFAIELNFYVTDKNYCKAIQRWESDSFSDEVKARYPDGIEWDVGSYVEDHKERMRNDSIEKLLTLNRHSALFVIYDKESHPSIAINIATMNAFIYYRDKNLNYDMFGSVYYEGKAQYKDGKLYFEMDTKSDAIGEEEIDYTFVFRQEGNTLVYIEEESDRSLGNIKDGAGFILVSPDYDWSAPPKS